MIIGWQSREILQDAANAIQKHSQSAAKAFVIEEIGKLASLKIEQAIESIRREATDEANAILIATGLLVNSFISILSVEMRINHDPKVEESPMNDSHRLGRVVRSTSRPNDNTTPD